MRYFAGFTEEDIAFALGVNERTVRRDWQKARLLLSLAGHGQEVRFRRELANQGSGRKRLQHRPPGMKSRGMCIG